MKRSYTRVVSELGGKAPAIKGLPTSQDYWSPAIKVLWPGRASSRRAKPMRTPGSTGVEGAGGTGGPGCGARGRWPGLAGLRDDAPSHTSATKRHCCGGSRRVRRARVGFEIDHSEPLGSRVAISRAAGPSGARNTSGATRPPGYAKGAGTAVPAPLSAHSATASSRLRPNDPQSWRRRRIHRNMPPTTAAPRPAPPIRPSKPVRARR